MNRLDALGEWQAAHDTLLAKERNLAQLAISFARREVSQAEVAKLHGDVEVFRKLTESLFSVAFGVKAPGPWSNRAENKGRIRDP